MLLSCVPSSASAPYEIEGNCAGDSTPVWNKALGRCAGGNYRISSKCAAPKRTVRDLMQERSLKINIGLSWHLVWIFAILEAVTVPLVPLFSKNGPSVNSTGRSAIDAPRFVLFAKDIIIAGSYGIAIGLIGTAVICLLLNFIAFRRVEVRLNDAIIMRAARPFAAALWGGVLLAAIFCIQRCLAHLLTFSWPVNIVAFGFVSAAGGFVVAGTIYLVTVKAIPHAGIQLVTTKQRLLLVHLPIVSFGVLAGLYEGLAGLILQRWELAHQHQVLLALLFGFSGGALGSLIVVALAHVGAVKKQLWLEFSVMAIQSD
jgi:hypothetical protein